MTDKDFENALTQTKKMFVLFYATWCPHSRRFLPIYQRCTENSPIPCLSVVIDNRTDLCDKYQIAYYPTVLFFVGDKVAKRLDAEPGEGLNEEQLRRLLNTT